MRDRRIAQQCRDIRNAQAFFVKEILGVFHSLLLVKIEYSGTENFLESFFEVTFVHRNLAAQFFDGDWVADTLQ